jgi:hypothetical protein
MVLEKIVVLLVDPSLGHIFSPLLVAKLEIQAPSWAISNVHAHLISTPTWERSMVLDQT